MKYILYAGNTSFEYDNLELVIGLAVNAEEYPSITDNETQKTIYDLGPKFDELRRRLQAHHEAVEIADLTMLPNPPLLAVHTEEIKEIASYIKGRLQ